MQKLEEIKVSPTVPYRRTLDGADFSLEANTKATPKQGRFYVMRKGSVLLDTRDFGEAIEAYQGMCRDYWHDHLDSKDPEERLSCAWGLLGLDPSDKEAASVVKEDGGSAAVKRLESLRRRHWAQRRAAGRRKKKA